MGRWPGYRPAPLKRIDSPKQNGQQRPRSIPPLEDRARQAVYLQALQPIAETTADPDSYGFRPTRRCADALDHGFKSLRQTPSATWILAGDIQGFFDNSECAWRAAHIPMPKRRFSQGLRRGFVDRGARVATTAGVPHGGISSPVISNMVWDGREAVVHGGNWPRRIHHSHSVRWAEDFSVTAHARAVLEETVLPRIHAFLAARGVRLSPTQTVITPISQGFAF